MGRGSGGWPCSDTCVWGPACASKVVGKGVILHSLYRSWLVQFLSVCAGAGRVCGVCEQGKARPWAARRRERRVPLTKHANGPCCPCSVVGNKKRVARRGAASHLGTGTGSRKGREGAAAALLSAHAPAVVFTPQLPDARCCRSLAAAARSDQIRSHLLDFVLQLAEQRVEALAAEGVEQPAGDDARREGGREHGHDLAALLHRCWRRGVVALAARWWRCSCSCC